MKIMKWIAQRLNMLRDLAVSVTAKGRNEQRKIVCNFLNASAIGSIAGTIFDVAQKNSKFDGNSAIVVGAIGFVFLILSYVLIGRVEEES